MPTAAMVTIIDNPRAKIAWRIGVVKVCDIPFSFLGMKKQPPIIAPSI
jgi:hypothetical protein